MDGLALLRRAQDAGLRLEVADTALKITGPKEAEPLVRLLAEHKAQVLEALTSGQRRGAEIAGNAENKPEGPQRHLLQRREERASTYNQVLAGLRAECPTYVDVADWQRAIEDGRRFVTEWGEQAEALGWTDADLFGLHTPPEKPVASYRRLSRYDETGLIWLLRGRPVVALTETTAAIQGATSVLTYRKLNKPALGPFGDSLDDMGTCA